MARKEKRTEKELAANVVSWLRDNGHELIWQEVKLDIGGVADIVVDVAGRGWVIETKQSFGFAVLAQARTRMQNGATRVSVASWATSRHNERDLSREVAQWLGIGVLAVTTGGSVHEELKPSFHRYRSKWHKDPIAFCNEGNINSCEAGSRGGYWTPFKRTCKELYALVLTRPGISLKDAVDGIEHHYSSTGTARASLSVWIKAGKVPGVVCKKEGRFLRLYAEDYEDRNMLREHDRRAGDHGARH